MAGAAGFLDGAQSPRAVRRQAPAILERVLEAFAIARVEAAS
jgi:hypothetical protein